MTGRIDVHSHLIPGVDDGCRTIEQAVECARLLVDAGYTHCFCTPHVWPNLENITRDNVRDWTARLQEELQFLNVPLTLVPGGELNLHPKVTEIPTDRIIPMGDSRYILADMWADKLPDFFHEAIRWLSSMGLHVILAHPERMRAVQDDPSIIDLITAMGVLLQGNLQCLNDPPEALTRQVAEKFLLEGRYFLLGSDVHSPEAMPSRLAGLSRAIELAGAEVVDQLTIHNPRKLLA